MLGEHLQYGLLAKVPSVTRQHRQEYLLFLAEVAAGGPHKVRTSSD
jgi:hypothetical protein